MATTPRLAEETLLAGLNESQVAAVTTTEGPVLVVAGPGSGKTRVLTHRIAYLIEHRNVSPEQILAVTFTNKAAREMRSRIENLIGADAVQGLVMGTFHSFGVRLLRQNPGAVAQHLGIRPNFLIYDDSDQLTLMKSAMTETGIDPRQFAPRRLLSRVSAAKSQLMTSAEYREQAESYDEEVIYRAFQKYEQGLLKANALDFDDLLTAPIRLFDADHRLLERYQRLFRYYLVDEYQDTNRVQYVLISALADYSRNLFVVGDPDQSIYGWRQADIRNILDFEQDYPDATKIHLEVNYRSTARIVALADKVIRENTQRIDRRLRTENPDGEMVMLRELADGNHEAQFVASEIRRLTATGGFSGKDIAVMYRTTAQSRLIEESLRISGIRYRIVGGVRFYDRAEVKDILAVLRLLYNPMDNVSLNRIVENLPIGKGIGPKAISTLAEWAAQTGNQLMDAFLALNDPEKHSRRVPLSGAAATAAKRIGAIFAKLQSQRTSIPLVELFDLIIEQTGYADRFNNSDEEDLQRWANLQELKSDLSRFDIVDPGDALGTYLEQVALVSDVDTMTDDSDGKVTLITLHSAKGLEFPVVFIVGCEEGLLPINRAIEAFEFNDTGPLEEERRLFYVGITRAMSRLYLTYAGSRTTYGRYQPSAASRFLEAVPNEMVSALTPGRNFRRDALKDRLRGSGHHSNLLTRVYEPIPTPAVSQYIPPDFRTGQRVFHGKFGEGIIAEVVPRKDDVELAVNFQRHGFKRLMASLARMDVVHTEAEKT